MRFPVAVILAVLALAAATATSAATQPQKPLKAQTTNAVRQRAVETQLVQAINALRRSRGLRPFTVSTKLASAAAQHSRDMGTNGYFQHESLDGSAFWKRIERWYSSRGWSMWSVGENIEYESPDITANEGLTMWLNSPPHRANLLSKSWREIGISAVHFDSAPGEYDGGAVTIVTADFGLRR